MDILKEIWEDYKKIILIILGAIFALIIVLIVFSIIIDPVKISFTGDDATTMIWKYIGELIFNMLVLVGTIKISDRVVKDMMGL